MEINQVNQNQGQVINVGTAMKVKINDEWAEFPLGGLDLLSAILIYCRGRWGSAGTLKVIVPDRDYRYEFIQIPTPGRIVLYRLSFEDYDRINALGHWARCLGDIDPAGEYPAVVLKVERKPGEVPAGEWVDINVFLPCGPNLYVKTVAKGEGAGLWRWPPRV